MGLVVLLSALTILVAAMLVGDFSHHSKCALGVIYLSTWLLVDLHPWAPVPAQALFSIVTGLMTFGTDWARR